MFEKLLKQLRGNHEKNLIFNSVAITNAEPGDWIRIVPIGVFPMHPKVGHEITSDHIVEMAENFKSSGTDLLFDYEHRSTWGDSIAAGWSYELKARKDGLYAKYPEWTKNARQMVDDKEYRYFSPAYVLESTDKLGRNMGAKIDHVALTNTPYMDNEVDPIGNSSTGSENPESTTKEKAIDMKLTKESLSILGLPEDATEEQVNQAIANSKLTPPSSEPKQEENKKEPNPEPVEKPNEEPPDSDLAAKINSLEQKLAEREQQEAETRSEALVNSAVEQGKINPADKMAWLTAAKANYDETKKALDERKANSALPGKVNVNEKTTGARQDQPTKNAVQECADFLRPQIQVAKATHKNST